MLNSKIPKLGKHNNIRRDSIASSNIGKQQNETRRPLSRIKNHVYPSQNTPKLKSTKSEIFKAQKPTMNALNSRKLPSDLQGKIKIIGNSNAINSLFRYLKYITQPYFVPEFHNRVFPKALSTLHQITVSKYEMMKKAKKNPRSSIAVASEIRSSDAKSKDLDLNPVFSQFQSMMKNHKNSLLSLTDFLLLYCSYLIIVCEGDTDLVLSPLYFLKQFLQLELPERHQETEILASVLLKQADSDPTVRGHSIQVLNQLANYDTTILNRIKTCCDYHDKNLAEFCKDVMKFIRRALPTDQMPAPPTFSEISPNANDNICNEMMSSFLSAFEKGENPRDPIGFIHNIIKTMERLINSPLILEKGSNNIRFALNLLSPSPPIEIISEIINLCLLLLNGESFLTGNDSFEAFEAIQSLSNTVFETVPSDILIPAITAVIAITDKSHLNHLMSRFSEYYQSNRNEINQRQLTEIASTLDAFQPDFKERPSFLKINIGFDDKLIKMSESIERLMSSETVFNEIEDIIQQDSEILNDYPLYLRGFLQRAYFLYNHEEPVGMSDVQKHLAEEMVHEMNSMNDDDFANGGKYSIESLSSQLEEMKAYNSSSW